MNRRTAMLLLAASLLPLPALAAPQPLALTPQDQADISRIESYLNGIRTLKARFLQVAPDGSTSGGLVWLQRPGRMRFQYDPPSPLLLVAGNGLFVFRDKQLDQTSNLPIGSTPLGILLRDQFTLSGDVTVSGIERQPGQIQVTVYRTSSPGDGTLTLVFADSPLMLKQWRVLDAQGQETQVTLFDVQLGGSFDPKMFVYINPKFTPDSEQNYK